MSRASGTITDTGGLGAHDHLCWAYDDVKEFRVAAGQFLAEGLQLGQRVCYVGDVTTDQLAADLRDAPGMDRALTQGAAEVAAVADTYPHGTVIEPKDQVAAYADATDRAVAAGFAGLRVAADVTALVRSPAQLDAFARYEHLIDDYMTERPFSAMCAYDRTQLGNDTIAQLACLHPNVQEGASPFRLHASTTAGCSAALAGELDTTTSELFPLALRRAAPTARDGRMTLDATGLRFTDHRALLALNDYARENDVTVVVQTCLSTVARITDLLGLDCLQVEAAA